MISSHLGQSTARCRAGWLNARAACPLGLSRALPQGRAELQLLEHLDSARWGPKSKTAQSLSPSSQSPWQSGETGLTGTSELFHRPGLCGSLFALCSGLLEARINQSSRHAHLHNDLTHPWSFPFPQKQQNVFSEMQDRLDKQTRKPNPGFLGRTQNWYGGESRHTVVSLSLQP